MGLVPDHVHTHTDTVLVRTQRISVPDHTGTIFPNGSRRLIWNIECMYCTYVHTRNVDDPDLMQRYVYYVYGTCTCTVVVLDPGSRITAAVVYSLAIEEIIARLNNKIPKSLTFGARIHSGAFSQSCLRILCTYCRLRI
jgi:hypothetical protein